MPPAAARGRLETGAAVGPDGYTETRLGVDADLLPQLHAGAAVSRSRVSGQSPRTLYSVDSQFLLAPGLDWSAGLAGACFHSPAANQVRSRGCSGDLSLALPSSTRLPGAQTLLRAGASRATYSLQISQNWQDVDQRGGSLELTQVLWFDWALSAGLWEYAYDRDLDRAAARALRAGMSRRNQSLLSAFGYLSGLPDSSWRLGIDWFRPAGGRLGGWFERVTPEVEAFGEVERRFGVEAELPVAARLDLRLGLELIRLEEDLEAYLDLGLSLLW